MANDKAPAGWIACAGGLGALGVAMGAFGAHALKAWLPLQVMTIFQTAVRYHMFHVAALLACAMLMALYPGRAARLRLAAWGFASGIVLFSGSLYALALTGWHWLGAVTPVGGFTWIAAWLLLAWAFLREGPA